MLKDGLISGDIVRQVFPHVYGFLRRTGGENAVTHLLVSKTGRQQFHVYPRVTTKDGKELPYSTNDYVNCVYERNNGASLRKLLLGS